MTRVKYNAEMIQRAVEEDMANLFNPWTLNRPENWKPDPATKAIISLGYFLDAELKCLLVEPEDRRTLLQKFNRISRSHDIWESAAECLNNVLDESIPKYESRRCKRWG